MDAQQQILNCLNVIAESVKTPVSFCKTNTKALELLKKIVIDVTETYEGPCVGLEEVSSTVLTKYNLEEVYLLGFEAGKQHYACDLLDTYEELIDGLGE